MGSQTVNKVGDTFIKFFEERNHIYWQSVPFYDDPTAGMNQLKPIFLGTTADEEARVGRPLLHAGYERHLRIALNHTCLLMLSSAIREVLGTHVEQKGSIVLPETISYDFSHGKCLKPEDLRRIESIVNEQIDAALDDFRKEAGLVDAKQVEVLQAVFGEAYPDLLRIVATGRQVDDLPADPENGKWLSICADLCRGTDISNTRDAKVFALMSEHVVAKGIRRVTAVTTDYAFGAFRKAYELEQEVGLASKLEGSLLHQKVTSLYLRVESAGIPIARKADLKAKISILMNQIRDAKRTTALEHID